MAAIKDKRMKYQRLCEMVQGSAGANFFASGPSTSASNPSPADSAAKQTAGDFELINWLQKNGFDEFTINRIVRDEEFCKQDFLDFVSSRDDLIRLGLR